MAHQKGRSPTTVKVNYNPFW